MRMQMGQKMFYSDEGVIPIQLSFFPSIIKPVLSGASQIMMGVRFPHPLTNNIVSVSTSLWECLVLWMGEIPSYYQPPNPFESKGVGA